MPAKKTRSSQTAKHLQLKKQLADITANWHRSIADYQNLVKRTNQERERQSKLAAKVLLTKLLPVYDHLLLAAETLADEGLALVVSDFEAVLRSEGVTQIDAGPNTRFDPEVHECVKLDPQGKPNLIVHQLRPGYRLDDQLLYPAKVTVGGQPEPSV